MEPVRISIEEQNIETIFYCEHLQLPQLLTRLGAGHLEGFGTVSGILPAVYQHGNRVLFQNGVLYSEPGEKGVLKGILSQTLAGGNPEDASKGEAALDLELAKDALKNFTYSWAKVYLDSDPREKNLILRLLLSGTPENPLYYEFNDEEQTFKKSETPVNFREIQLQMNFSIPEKAEMPWAFFSKISKQDKK